MAQSAHTHGPAYPEEEVPLPTHTHKHTEYSVKNAYIRILYIKTEMLLLKKKGSAARRTSRGMNGWKKQSRSLSKEQVRLLSIEVITSVTDFLTNIIASCGHTYINLKYIQTALSELFPGYIYSYKFIHIV